MYHITNVKRPRAFANAIGKVLNHRPSECLGVRLLVSLDNDESFIVVSYWSDMNRMLTGAASLHVQIKNEVEGLATPSKVEKYEIKHEI